MSDNEALFKYTLRLGDTSLILAQRLCEWTGHGPFLEEDLALTNIALDIFGRGKSMLEYAAKLEGKGRTEDDLAFFRNDREYFNALITEQPNGDYAKTIIRQALIDCFDLLFYTELAKSKDVTLSGIAQKSIKEITYHKRHSFSWVNRFGNGTEESLTRLQNGLNDIWSYTGELFEMTEVDTLLIKKGIAVDLSVLKPLWEKEINQLLVKANLVLPESLYMHSGSRNGLHSEHLSYILAEMQSIPRMHPTAKW
ncbi:MAG: 1,2-phenylacetyl-CoA epoxidase subunit PaaC [Bacteroidota bacterium]|nr:1,2-phenylacetyl-CoA epoxidase subunit PaaC [Bacteroidota bacterium]MDP3144434.1 1,2-phenylacetyl-CoA epoxidase subunit PaaC [Bacteroidota bacterium]MDP3555888.1 1,2-phenylacetyl-CoA epoxidase subunit PaaC [Bacteroidota bacterium]